MKKLSVLAAIATLAFAAPALAQTPSDVKNFRTPSYGQGASEVKLDHSTRTMRGSEAATGSMDTTEHHGKKHHGKHHHAAAKKHHGKHHHKADAAKTEAPAASK